VLNRYGSWAVCFTYGTWFGVKGLVAAGKNFNNCSSIRQACDFLLSKQLPSGGWGESYLSCQNKVDFINITSNVLFLLKACVTFNSWVFNHVNFVILNYYKGFASVYL
jgi:squalene cyclase